MVHNYDINDDAEDGVDKLGVEIIFGLTDIHYRHRLHLSEVHL